VSDVGGIVGFVRLRQKDREGLLRSQIFGGVVTGDFLRQFSAPIISGLEQKLGRFTLVKAL
jgi:hypothetical protein